MAPTDSLHAEASVHPHDHVVLVYGDDAGLWTAFARHLEEGLARGEACALVHGFDDEADAWRAVTAARADARELARDGRLTVSDRRAAFERGGAIDVEHVARVTAGLLDAAGRRGLAGLRIFVDASRRYLPARRAEWFAFESWLCPRLAARASLVCAYRRADVLDPLVLPDVLRTHAYRLDAGPRPADA